MKSFFASDEVIARRVLDAEPIDISGGHVLDATGVFPELTEQARRIFLAAKSQFDIGQQKNMETLDQYWIELIVFTPFEKYIFEAIRREHKRLSGVDAGMAARLAEKAELLIQRDRFWIEMNGVVDQTTGKKIASEHFIVRLNQAESAAACDAVFWRLPPDLLQDVCGPSFLMATPDFVALGEGGHWHVIERQDDCPPLMSLTDIGGEEKTIKTTYYVLEQNPLPYAMGEIGQQAAASLKQSQAVVIEKEQYDALSAETVGELFNAGAGGAFRIAAFNNYGQHFGVVTELENKQFHVVHEPKGLAQILLDVRSRTFTARKIEGEQQVVSAKHDMMLVQETQSIYFPYTVARIYAGDRVTINPNTRHIIDIEAGTLQHGELTRDRSADLMP